VQGVQRKPLLADSGLIQVRRMSHAANLLQFLDYDADL
jgi:hypothetical protein